MKARLFGALFLEVRFIFSSPSFRCLLPILRWSSTPLPMARFSRPRRCPERASEFFRLDHERTPIWTQILFFGALLSAILSTASGTLLAPSSLFTENVIRPFAKGMDDKRLLWTMRGVMAVFALSATLFAINSDGTMYQMVQNAYKVTLVMAFVPLAFGVFWKKASTQGAIFACVAGLAGWLFAEWFCGTYGLTEEGDSPELWKFVNEKTNCFGASPSFRHSCTVWRHRLLECSWGGWRPQWIPKSGSDPSEIKRTSSIVGH